MHISLPMYDIPELHEDVQRLWVSLRRVLIADGFDELPEAVVWPANLDAVWRSPDLFLSQTCGYLIVRGLEGVAQLVGIPHYDAPNCEGFNYSSALIVARNAPHRSLADLRGSVAGFNELESHSGHNALRYAVAPLAGGAPFFSAVKPLGRHEASIEAVITGAVDLAAVDSITLTQIGRHRPARVAAVRILGYTKPVPAPPLITTGGMPESDLARLRLALVRVFADPELEAVRARLLLTGISFPAASVYGVIADQERAAAELGYPDLR
jgi:ABC-type phosphate/phosphonate transport system substrate-binding protein